MSAVALLEAYIKDLNGCVSSGNAQSIYDPNSLATDIATQVLSEISTDDYDYACSLLFNRETGIIYFLRQATQSNNKDLKSAQYSLLNFMVSFIEKAQSTLQPYITTIKNCCSFILRGKQARVRCAALEVMFAIFDAEKSKLDTVVLNVEDLFNKYIEMAVLPITSLPQSVKGRVLELLGMISKHYPEIAAPQINAIKRWSLTSLEEHLVDHKAVSFELAASALKTFNLILSSPELMIDPDSAEGERLYNSIALSLKIPEELPRYALQMAALTMMQNNARLFSDDLIRDYKKLYTRILKCCEHQNRPLSQIAYGALESLLKETALALSKSRNNEKSKEVFLYYIDRFHKLLDEKDVVESFRKNSIAIRGIGYFSKVSNNFLDKVQTNDLIQLLVKKSDWFYSESNSETYRVLGHLPSFIQAYTYFSKGFDPIPLDLLVSIQRISGVFAVSFARMPIYNRTPGIIAIKELFQMLYDKGEGVLRNFLDNFFNKAMICTCTDIELPGHEKQHSYVDLLYFWKSILTDTIENINIDIEYDEADEDAMMIDFDPNTNESEAKLKDVLCDCFMDTVLYIIKMLNLDLKKVGGEEEAAEDEVLYVMSGSLQPVNPKDFILFQNLVEFWCLLLKDMENSRLTEWFYITGSSLVDQSLQKPLVSGFYRMIAQLMVIIEKQKYFRGFKDILHTSRPTQDQIEKSKSDAYNTYLVVHGYMKDILHKSQQFKDELLASCLHLILSYPIEFFDLTELVVPLKTALHFGISYSPLAVAALDTLEKLQDPETNMDTDSAFLCSVLPSINEYLIVKVHSNQETLQDINESKKRFKVRSANQRQYAVNRNDMSSDEVGVIDSSYTSLEELQLQMMRYLGRLGAKSKQMLQSSEERDDVISWDPKKHLKIDVPFPNSKVEVSMGELLPRVCDLAESSPDRHLKVAACELLHSLVLVMIGNSAFQAKDTRHATESKYHGLYLRVFPVMLKLAIDVDQVARDMFRLLNAQIIHWLTNNAQYENPETIALLEACLEAACDTNAGLRDYGADCVQEFAKWSIKQSSSKSKNNPMNIKSLLKRLYNFMTNPNSSKRFGASLVFNRIYRLFREEESLIEEYTLEILGQLFFSLKLSESDHPSIGTSDQTREAISHIKRIIRRKSDLFIQESPTRRPFLELAVTDLGSVVEWTLMESGKDSRLYAKVCMDFFVEFIKLVPGVKSPKSWMSQKLKAEPHYLADIYESGQLESPLFPDGADCTELYSNWINRFNCAVDGYIWLVERDVINPIELVRQGSSNLIKNVLSFFQNTAKDFLKTQSHFLASYRLKCISVYSYTCTRFIYLFEMMLDSTSDMAIKNEIYQKLEHIFSDGYFTKELARTLLFPKQVYEEIQLSGTNSVTNSSINRTFTIAKKFITAIKKVGSEHIIRLIIKSIHDIIEASNLDLTNAGDMQEHSFTIEMLQTIDGICFIQIMGLLDLLRSYNSVFSSSESYYLKLFEHFTNYSLMCHDPLQIQLFGRMLRISFYQPEFAEKYASHLLGFSGHFSTLTKQDRLTIFQKFKEYVYCCTAIHFKAFLPTFIKNINNTTTCSYIVGFLEYFKENRISKRKEIAAFTKIIVEDPEFLEAITTEWKDDDHIQILVVALTLLFGADPGIMTRATKLPTSRILWNIFLELLDSKYPYRLRNNVLDLLPIFIATEASYKDQIEKKLRSAITDHFPIQSSSIPKGSTMYNDYITSLDKLLQTMVSFKSVMIFKLLMPILVNEKNHTHAETIKLSIANFSKGLGRSTFLEVTQYCYQLYTEEDKYSADHRLSIIQLLISLLPRVDTGHVYAFYEKNILDIMDRIGRKIPWTSPDKKQLTIKLLKEKIACYNLMQAMYETLPKDLIHGPKNTISAIYEEVHPAPPNTQLNFKTWLLTPKLFRILKDDFKENMPNLTGEIKQYRLVCNQACFSACTAALLYTTLKPTSLWLTIFAEKEGVKIWRNIFDEEQELSLKIELDDHFITARLKDFRIISSSHIQKYVEKKSSYMTSVDLEGSSLSQGTWSEEILDAMSLDDASKSMRELTLESSNPDPMNVVDTPPKNEMEQSVDDYEVDIFNQNLCIRSLTESIEYLHNNVTKPDPNKSTMPVWMKHLFIVFTDKDAPLVRQLYLAKLILNFPQAFEHYAAYWMIPLMRLVTKGARFGEPMNYYVQDLCIVLITWGSQIPFPEGMESKHALLEFLRFLISNSYHENTRICRSNLKIIKGAFDAWDKHVIVPTKAVFDQISSKDRKSKRNILGLQVLGIIFSKNINPYSVESGIKEDGITEFDFYSAMADNIYNKNQLVFANAAELIGWSLHFMKDNITPLATAISSMYEEKVKMLHGTKSSDAQIKLVACASRISIHEQKFGYTFLGEIIFIFPHLVDKPKVHALEFITASCDVEERVFNTLKYDTIVKMMRYRNDRCQTAVLKFLIKLAPVLSEEHLNKLLGELTKVFPDHSNADCKTLYYSLLKILCGASLSPTLQNKIQMAILQGIIDKNESISEDILEFIQKHYTMDDNIYSALINIMKNMYIPQIENLYIFYSTRVLFSYSKKSYEYKKPIFENPLPNARFDADYHQINTSWRKNLSMTPLFVSNQEEVLSMDDIEHKIKATLKSLDFSQTQPGAVSLLYSFNPSDEALQNYSDLFQDQVRDLPASNSSQMKSMEAYSQLGKRFVKSTKNKTSNYFVRQHERLQKRLRKYQSYQKEANEKKVDLYRSYRLGELPDIQIGHMDIIRPLEKLACSDFNISRMIYSNLVVSIVKNSLEETRSENLEFQDEVIDAIRVNLTNSTQCFTPTIASFLRICFDLNATNFDSTLIRQVSTRSNNHHIGIAFLENQLLKHDNDEDENRSKRIRMSEGGQLRHEKKKWIDLSLLFKEIDESEIFQSTYQNYVASNNLSKDAIAAEVSAEYARAYNLFKEAKDTLPVETDPKETSLWDEEMLRCFEQLTQWDDIAIQVRKALPNTNYDKLWESGYKDFYLNYFMKSFTRLREGIEFSSTQHEMWTSDNPNPIFKFVGEALVSTSKKNYLVQHFPCEVSITEMLQKNHNSGRYIIRNSYNLHLNEWSTMHPLAHTSRLKKLIELQRTVEIEDYFELLADIKSSPDSLYKTKPFFSLLQHRYPDSKVDSMSIWDDIIDTRLLFIENLKDSISEGSRGNIYTVTSQAKLEFLEKMADAAYKQGIDNVAIKYLAALKEIDQTGAYEFGFLQQRYVQSAKMPKGNPKRNKAIASTLVKCLEHKIPGNFPFDKVFDNRLLMSKIYRFVFNEIQDNPNTFTVLASLGSVKSSVKNSDGLSSIYKFAEFLEERGYQQFSEIEDNIFKEDEIYTKCLWEFGRYCDDMLRSIRDSPNKLHPQIDQNHYSEIVVKNYLMAMDRGSKIAAERFPRLLELIELYPDSGEVFKEYSNSFNGTWMYIQWIPQLVAILDTKIAKFVFPSIKRLAESYPNALYYPFHISFEHYEIIKDKLDLENAESIEQINGLLRSPLKEEFLLELRRLTDPEHILKDFIDFIQSVVNSQEAPKSFVVNAFEQISQLLLNPYNARLGTIPKAFAVKHATALREIMGKNGAKLPNMSSKDVAKILQYCENSNQKTSGGSRTGANLLKSYSPWLAKFKIGDHAETLEIPGQYDGLSIPYPEHHSKIARFDESVLVMTSMRKPKRVRIYGTDEKEYKFLVKGGEDLRLDQRIQQLFTVMNNIISKNGYCARQDVNIVTYKVVPMASNIGIIEWVDDTKPLRACIEEEVNSKMLLSRMLALYKAWIQKCVPGTKKFTECYQKAFTESRENVTKHLEDTSNYIEPTAMRDYLMRLASSPEAFLFIRKGFAHSLAAISIYGYILGIGDRHLENFLLDLKTGRLLPIDFGHAFGSATELLPIPELVPFRLTRQLVGALEPLGISGALEHVMVYILQAIRDDKEILINTMDVFVKEPLLDWKKFALKQAKVQNKTSASESVDVDGSYKHDVKWYPQQKMDIAMRKLNGDNPSEILITELINGHQNQRYLEPLKEIAKGDLNINYRASVKKRCSNVQEQVKCLIDLATDPLVLGVAWVGWQSYI